MTSTEVDGLAWIGNPELERSLVVGPVIQGRQHVRERGIQSHFVVRRVMFIFWIGRGPIRSQNRHHRDVLCQSGHWRQDRRSVRDAVYRSSDNRKLDAVDQETRRTREYRSLVEQPVAITRNAARHGYQKVFASGVIVGDLVNSLSVYSDGRRALDFHGRTIGGSEVLGRDDTISTDRHSPMGLAYP